MAYMCDISQILADQLAKFATLHRHQLAGQVANLEFWCDELQHCLTVLDGYKARFEWMKAAQMKYTAEHKTMEFRLDLDDPCCFPEDASPPRRIDHREVQAARQSVCDAMYRFIVRCLRESLIDETRFREVADRFGMSIEHSDVER